MNGVAMMTGNASNKREAEAHNFWRFLLVTRIVLCRAVGVMLAMIFLPPIVLGLVWATGYLPPMTKQIVLVATPLWILVVFLAAPFLLKGLLGDLNRHLQPREPGDDHPAQEHAGGDNSHCLSKDNPKLQEGSGSPEGGEDQTVTGRER